MGRLKSRMPRVRELMGILVAVGILTAVFVPFQQATAFTVTIDLPDSEAGAINNAVAGEPFEIIIDVEAGELISIEEITLILDNGLETVNIANFDSTGQRVGGNDDLVIDNELAISGFSDTGYAYGFGTVSYGITGFSSYSYSFTTTEDHIGGNTIGYSNPGVTDFVTGLLGPGNITISGKLRTATLEDGTHTLDVLINTGAGVDPDELTTDTFSFTVEEDDSVVVDETPVTTGATRSTVTTTDSSGNAISIGLNFGNATTTTGNVVVVVQDVDDFIAANSEAELEAQGFELDGDDLVFTTGDDDNTFIAVGFIVDIDVSALGLPDGTLVTLSMDYDDTGLSSSEENRVRLMHQLDTGDEWEALANDDETINDGDEVDTENNIVYGTTDDFSLFAPAVRETVSVGDDDDDDGGSSGGGGGGGGSRTVTITWPAIDTLPAEHFINFPLDRIQVANSAFVNAAGVSINAGQVNQQISISGQFSNYQEVEQDYAFIVQIIDGNDVVTDIAWQQGTLAGGSTTEVSTLWTPELEGEYTVKIFVWDGIGTTPEPLSEVTIKNIEVS